MGIEELQRIKKILEGHDFEVIEHEPVRTSEDAARIRNAPLKAGIKAIVVRERSGSRFFVADVPADKRVDLKKLASVVGASSLTMASPEEVLRETGCEVGGVPPLGHKKEIPIFVDLNIFDNEFNEFNAGLTTTSVRISTVELKQAFEKVKATIASFAK